MFLLVLIIIIEKIVKKSNKLEFIHYMTSGEVVRSVPFDVLCLSE